MNHTSAANASNSFDVAIIGSGYSGSLLAWVLASQGVTVALIDSQRHPRFAIGESSTPIADLLLRRLGQQYQLPLLQALSSWGSWQQTHPEIAGGCKRGFSYFMHQPGRPFDEPQLGEYSLLVAASASDETADTHWYRPEVDQCFFKHAVKAGATDRTGSRVVSLDQQTRYRLRLLDAAGAESDLQADWVIDASGQAGVVPHLLQAQDRSGQLQTNTRTCFAHYRGVQSWTQYLTQRGHWADDPFDPDDAAQHHLVDGGWVWMLRFNNGITSVGWTSTGEPDMRWSNYPSLMDLMGPAERVAPSEGVRRTARLQRWFDPVAADRILLLPGAAFTLDPLHSTGIAQGLAGVQRVAEIVLQSDSRLRGEQLSRYRSVLDAEVRLLDQLVSTAYATMADFERFVIASMLYFAAAIRCEEDIQAGRSPEALWNARDREFLSVVEWACEQLRRGRGDDLAARVRERLQPWNTAGLLDPHADNRYAYTATKG